ILNGICSIQPKIDGTNAVVWLGEDGIVHAGSRKRNLTLENDNAYFYNSIIKDENVRTYLLDHPNNYLYGEWLVPHTIRYYSPDAWEKFYVFDVFNTERGYLPYNEYTKELDEYGITYIPEIKKLINPTMDDLKAAMLEAKFLIPEDKMSEGIVIKNYEYKNPYGRTTWAKIISEEFFGRKYELKSKNRSVKKQELDEGEIVTKLLSEPLIRKEYAKICIEFPESSRQERIGRILTSIWHVFLKEEFMDYAEKKKPKVEFNLLKKACDNQVREVLKTELFS
ncbi:MAG: RNA ligase family protein, partial [Erysipelotrichaceae bacterium]|nr:RNA ligase family protein [Erysipelotrichaceae bacterium]